MTQAQIRNIKSRITSVLQTHAHVAPAQSATLLPIRGLQGKLYEAHVLATICQGLVSVEGLRASLVNNGSLRLKQKGGPINRQYPYFKFFRNKALFGELFTDIEFTSLSHHLNGAAHISNGDYHELDIALLQPNCAGRPSYNQVLLAAECKNTSIKKSIIREVLGFRRELSFYSQHPNSTQFAFWPTSTTNSNPNSVHMLYCSHQRVNRYLQNCLRFGILLVHHRI
jgi:hypothetical protein